MFVSIVNFVRDFTCKSFAKAHNFSNGLYLKHRLFQLFLNWTGSDPHSGIHDYEVGLATSGSADVPDISGYQTTHHHAFYEQFHPTLTQGTPFYILVKAINKAGLETVQVIVCPNVFCFDMCVCVLWVFCWLVGWFLFVVYVVVVVCLLLVVVVVVLFLFFVGFVVVVVVVVVVLGGGSCLFGLFKKIIQNGYTPTKLFVFKQTR